MFFIGLEVEVGSVILHRIILEEQIIIIIGVQNAVDGVDARTADRSYRKPFMKIGVVGRIHFQVRMQHSFLSVHALGQRINDCRVKLQIHVPVKTVLDHIRYHRVFFHQAGLLLDHGRPDQHLFHGKPHFSGLVLPGLVEMILKVRQDLLHQLVAGCRIRHIIGIRVDVPFQLIEDLLLRRQLILIGEIFRLFLHRKKKIICFHNVFLLQTRRYPCYGIPLRDRKGGVALLLTLGGKLFDQGIQRHAIVDRKGSVLHLPPVIRQVGFYQERSRIADHPVPLEVLGDLGCGIPLIDRDIDLPGALGILPQKLCRHGIDEGQQERYKDQEDQQKDPPAPTGFMIRMLLLYFFFLHLAFSRSRFILCIMCLDLILIHYFITTISSIGFLESCSLEGRLSGPG